jgi:hypothetical protein
MVICIINQINITKELEMRNSNNKQEMSQIRKAVNTGLGLLTAGHASTATALWSIGELNGAFASTSLAGAALLYVTYVQKDDHKANGLKSYSWGFAVGAFLSVIAPPDREAKAQTLYSEGPKAIIVHTQSATENNYPELATVAFD